MKFQHLGNLIVGTMAAAEVAAAFDLQQHQYPARHRRRDNSRRYDPDMYAQWPAHTIPMPLDHFKNDSRYEPHSDASFNVRYWFDASHYKRGGPVIVLNSGVGVGSDRLPFLVNGMLAQLAEATSGIAVILEHRFYGESYPSDMKTSDSTALRFLSTDQGMADMAYFARNVVFPGLESYNLTAPGGTPWIAYGASYAGGLVAFVRKTYPDLYWGAVSSSAMTHAKWDFWEYWEAARHFSPPGCADATMSLTDVLDKILVGKKGTDMPQLLRDVYGLGNLTSDVDLAGTLSQGLFWLQYTNWDANASPSAPDWNYYCNNLTASTLLYPELANRTTDVQKLLDASGYASNTQLLTTMLNHMGFIFAEYVKHWTVLSASYTQDEWFGAQDASSYPDDSIESLPARAWAWQWCTEWGYLRTGKGTPQDMKPMVSRLLDVQAMSPECRFLFNRTGQEANVSVINQYGGLDISYSRLAFIGGTNDPWRQAGPQALGQPARNSTKDQPWILIDGAVHHWDENGVNATEITATFPPPAVQAAQAQAKDFVKAWLADYPRTQGIGLGRIRRRAG